MTATIKCSNLEIGYKTGKESILVSRIQNLELTKGKLTCLLGANGIGKSTLLRTITGNLPPLAGEIYIDRKEIAELSTEEKAKKLAVVLTDKARLGFTTVREMVILGRNPYTNWMNKLEPGDLKAIDTALEAIGMTDLANKPLAELSDGNLQKVIIGRALAQATEIIILDEPTVHLDIKNKLAIVNLLRDLCTSHGKTILFSTHDLDLAKLYADELWIMEENEVIQGLTEDLILNGSLQKSFDYDQSTISKNYQNIQMSCSDEDAKLLRRALTKAGIPNDVSGSLKLSTNSTAYELSFDGHRFTNIPALITYLDSLSRIR